MGEPATVERGREMSDNPEIDEMDDTNAMNSAAIMQMTDNMKAEGQTLSPLMKALRLGSMSFLAGYVLNNDGQLLETVVDD